VTIAAVLGGATRGMYELRSLPRCNAVFAVNDAAAQYPGPLAAFVTLHPEHLPRWLGARRAAGLPDPDRVVVPHDSQLPTQDARDCAAGHERADYRWPGMNASGSSGLFATKIALEAGHDRVVLCGVPMEAARAHFFNTALWAEVDAFRGAWGIALPHLRERVRSMSGWTAELLGTPSTEWLA
jgi:hypothetical protein